MSLFNLTVCVILGACTAVFTAVLQFTYDPDDVDHGPSNWGSSCGSAVRQSPINIGKKNVKYGQPFSISHDNSDVILDGNLVNNGHSITFALRTTTPPILTLDGVPEVDGQTFALDSFHFHFGPTDDVGSEHTLNYQSFPAEIHFVYVNTKYTSFQDALENSDGMAVIGAFFKVDGNSNSEIESITRQTNNILTAGAQVLLSVSLNTMLPSLTEMYSYAGSLTTPPCSEVVQWFVAKETMSITQQQLTSLRKARTGDATSALISEPGNFRSVQPIQGRDVLANFKPNLRKNCPPG